MRILGYAVSIVAKEHKQKQKRKSWEIVEGDPTAHGGALKVDRPTGVRPSKTTLSGLIFTICFCLTWTGFLIVGLWNCTMNVSSDWFGTNTTGVITKKFEEDGKDSADKYYLDFNFKVGERTEHGECDTDLISYDKAKVGAEVPVRYWSGLPACSAYVAYDRFIHFNFGLFFVTLIGLVGWIFGIAAMGAQVLQYVVGWWRSLKDRNAI